MYKEFTEIDNMDKTKFFELEENRIKRNKFKITN